MTPTPQDQEVLAERVRVLDLEALKKVAGVAPTWADTVWEINQDARTDAFEVRVALDGDVDGDTGRHLITGGEVVALLPDVLGDGDLAKFIATFDPPTVRALLARAEALEAENARLRGDGSAERIAELIAEGDGFWRSCSGCYETNEGYPTAPTDAVFKAPCGSGCRECGGLGVVWDNTDYGDMAKFMLADMKAEDEAGFAFAILATCAARGERDANYNARSASFWSRQYQEQRSRAEAAEARNRELEANWLWLAENTSLELSHGELDGWLDDCAWRVHRVSGGYNDREWTLIATGETPLEAVQAARQALQTKEGSSNG